MALLRTVAAIVPFALAPADLLHAQSNMNPCAELWKVSRWQGQLKGTVRGSGTSQGIPQTIDHSGEFQLNFATRASAADPFGDLYTFGGDMTGTVKINDFGGGLSANFSGPVSYLLGKQPDSAVLTFTPHSDGSSCAFIFHFPSTVENVSYKTPDKEFVGAADWLAGALPLSQTLDSDTFLLAGYVVLGKVPPTALKVERSYSYSRSLGGIQAAISLSWNLEPYGIEDIDTSSEIKAPLTFEPPKVSDTVFVEAKAVIRSPGAVREPLVDACNYRSKSPIRIPINVTRHAGEINSDGTLVYAKDLIKAGLLSPKAKLVMPAYDVDSSARVAGREPELNRVLFNGQEVGYLSGRK